MLLIKTGLLSLVLTQAVMTDLKQRRISNRLCLLTLLIGLSLQIVDSGFSGMMQAGMSLTISILFLYPFFYLGGMGAGDVKLIAAIASFFPPLTMIFCVAMILVCGGLIAILPVLYSQFTQRFYMENKTMTIEKPKSIPYAPAIAIGVMMTVYFSI